MFFALGLKNLFTPNKWGCGGFDPVATTGPPEVTSLRGNTPYDVKIVKIGLRMMAQRDPKNKERKVT